MLSAPCGSTPIPIRAADCLLHAALHRWARSVFDRPRARMRGLALAEIAAVDLDIAVFGWWPRRSFLSAISSKRFVAGRMPQRREDRGRGQQHRFRRIEAR